MYTYKEGICDKCAEKVWSTMLIGGQLLGYWYDIWGELPVEKQVHICRVHGEANREMGGGLCFYFYGGEDDLHLCEQHLREALEGLVERGE